MGPVRLKPVRPSGKLPLISCPCCVQCRTPACHCWPQAASSFSPEELHGSASKCMQLQPVVQLHLELLPACCSHLEGLTGHRTHTLCWSSKKELAKQPQWCLVSLDDGVCFFYHVQTTHRFSCPCTNAPKSRSEVRASCLIQECGHNLISCFTPSMKPRCPDWWLPLIGVTIKVAIEMTDFLWHWQCCNYQQMHIM